MESAPISSGKILSLIQQNIYSDGVKGTMTGYHLRASKVHKSATAGLRRSWKSDLRPSFKRRRFSW